MKKSQLIFLLVTIFLAIGLTFFGALAKLEHWPYSNYYMTAGMLLQVALIGFTIYIIITSYRKKKQLTKRN